jgi:hypothetical protein
MIAWSGTLSAANLLAYVFDASLVRPYFATSTFLNTCGPFCPFATGMAAGDKKAKGGTCAKDVRLH